MIATILLGVGVTVALIAWINVGFSVTAYYACRRMERRIDAAKAPARWPSIWMLRPCEGTDVGLEEGGCVPA